MKDRPVDHAMWCTFGDDMGDGFGPCTCDLDARQSKWDADNRSSGAAPIPVARLVTGRKSS